MMRGGFSLAAIFGAPLLLAVLSLIGIVGALLADSLWDWIGAGLLAACLVTIVWARFVRRRPLRTHPPGA